MEHKQLSQLTGQPSDPIRSGPSATVDAGVNPARSPQSEVRTVVDVLLAAKARIRVPQLWCKVYAAKGKQCCALRALGIVAGDDELRLQQAKRTLEVALPKKHQFISHFNDDPATTHKDVMALFDRAIELAKEAS